MPIPEGVRVFLAPNPSIMTGPGTNTYLVAGEGGPCVVIDPGPDDTRHLEAIARAAATQGNLAAILITHGHRDHDEGAAHLRALTGAPVLAWSREGVPATDRTLADGERVFAGNRALRVVHTPGHRFDHLCFLLEDAGALFAGDLVAGVGTVVIVPPDGDLADYLASLDRLLGLAELRTILAGHGPPVENGPALLREYVAHRLMREQQVLEGLQAGLTTIPALVAHIYADVDPALHSWAGRTVAAHLLKLEREGRVARQSRSSDEGPWLLTRAAG